MSAEPSISVIIPNYNHAPYLPECLDAILSQTRLPEEIIIVDDKSTDNSLQVIQDYQKKSSLIRLICNPRNIGVCEIFNTVASEAIGDFIALCGADDFLLPNFFEKTSAVIAKNPELGLVTADTHFFSDEKPYRFSLKRGIPNKNKVEIFSHQETIQLLSQKFFIASWSTLYQKNAYLRFRHDKKLASLSDFYLNCQIALHYPIAYIPEPLACARIQVKKGSYGDRIRKSLGVRKRVYRHLMDLVLKKEDLSFRRDFKKADLLCQTGFFLLLTAALTPSYWIYLPSMIVRVLRHKRRS